jgi:hypothetical protein
MPGRKSLEAKDAPSEKKQQEREREKRSICHTNGACFSGSFWSFLVNLVGVTMKG